ncbi:hypothetical protein JVT61DRAFT_3480 [Boletus reticuloceps]|uniref:Uncharacterized protein n=1 Tax=Boletus reticuloceps TaxID=495285 RepID=A0A8I3A800_9AGAM|nr:hypothetical protein JVT61DRAFT_3480 [Boletus reticuloceps]
MPPISALCPSKLTVWPYPMIGRRQLHPSQSFGLPFVMTSCPTQFTFPRRILLGPCETHD